MLKDVAESRRINSNILAAAAATALTAPHSMSLASSPATRLADAPEMTPLGHQSSGAVEMELDGEDSQALPSTSK